MAITNVRQQVLQDFRDKLSLEPKLGKKLRKLDRDIVQQFRQDMLRGEVTRAEDFRPELQVILEQHYDLVENKFEGRIADQMPEDVAITTEEQVILATALAAFFGRRAIEQSRIITSTTQGDMRTAAQAVASETADQVERAVTASSILERRLRAREVGIASLETQAAAEAVKGAEFDMLAGKRPLSLERIDDEMLKEWVTVGDERVRDAHVEADSQVQLVQDLFQVGGQELRWPGDTAMGATASNVINCRCSAVYENGALFAQRKKRKEAAPLAKDIQVVKTAKPKTKVIPVSKSKKPLKGVEDLKLVKSDKPPKLPDTLRLTSEEEGALSYYKGSGYYDTNKVLRNQSAFSAEQVSAAKAIDGRISSAVKKSVSESDGVLYRGLRSEKIFKDAESLIGKNIPISTPQSTATNAGAGVSWSGLIRTNKGDFFTSNKGQSVVLKIRTKKGQSLIDMESLSIGNTKESEVLLKSGGHYQVRAVRKLKDDAGNVTGKVLEVDYNE